MEITLMPLGSDLWFGHDLKAWLELWKIADAKGVDGLSMTDHVVVGQDLSAHPHEYGGIDDFAAWRYEPIVLLTAIGAVTEHIKLGTNVLLAGLRPATLLAKQIATLDVLTGGRTEFVVGTGWQRYEYNAQDAPFESRYGLLFETVQACKALWSSAPVDFHGKHIDFTGAYSLPLPVQSGGPPILVGLKATDRNVDRIARYADGWSPLGLSLEETAEGAEKIRAKMTELGRDASEFRLKVKPLAIRDGDTVDTEASIASMSEWAAIGVTQYEFVPAEHLDSPDGFEQFLESILAERDRLD
ncbi:MAG: F420-dependent oxidoreductase [Microbacteriaceae bacterium]|nr:F420-dependent oxidoreductase [Microbacteriaceae bacterium]